MTNFNSANQIKVFQKLANWILLMFQWNKANREIILINRKKKEKTSSFYVLKKPQNHSIYIRGFTKFGIKVLWRLQFLEYLRALHLKFQKARTKIEVVLALPCRLSQLLSIPFSYLAIWKLPYANKVFDTTSFTTFRVTIYKWSSLEFVTSNKL